MKRALLAFVLLVAPFAVRGTASAYLYGCSTFMGSDGTTPWYNVGYASCANHANTGGLNQVRDVTRCRDDSNSAVSIMSYGPWASEDVVSHSRCINGYHVWFPSDVSYQLR